DNNPDTSGLIGVDVRLNSDEINTEFVVAVANRRLGSQVRDTALDESNISNYLEGSNADAGMFDPDTYVVTDTAPFNDIVCRQGVICSP
ncbi:MAG: hypothetical protein AAF512_06120, partial [Pseudomonadota bacterium]